MKNWILILSILILPLIGYFSLEKTNTNIVNYEAKAQTGKAMVIKFYSPMCLDCKKLETVMNEIMPKYSDVIIYQSLNGQSNDKNINELIEKYNVNVVPTTVFIKKDGNIHKKIEGTMTKKELENHLKALIK